jgi:hypothetical protein
MIKKIEESINEGDVNLSQRWAVVFWGDWKRWDTKWHTYYPRITRQGHVGLIHATFDTQGQANRRAKEDNAIYEKGFKRRQGTDYQVVDLSTIPKSDITQ